MAPRHRTRDTGMNALSRLATLVAMVLLAGVLGLAPAAAVTTDDPPPPPPSDDKKDGKGKADDKKDGKGKAIEEFREGYRAAYRLVYEQGRYADGIAALRALGRDDHADVANLIGFASRKLGRYDDAKVWYERALAADPNHSRTWSYYGMWHAEQGNMLKAQDHLEKVRLICGNTECRDYRELKGVMDGTRTY
jgi:tetratricopeptide (TPR) repeat protein